MFLLFVVGAIVGGRSGDALGLGLDEDASVGEMFLFLGFYDAGAVGQDDDFFVLLAVVVIFIFMVVSLFVAAAVAVVVSATVSPVLVAMVSWKRSVLNSRRCSVIATACVDGGVGGC